jgi:glycerol-3-phosphate dehydrogenase
MRALLPPRPPRGRGRDLERLAGTPWDLVVVGGGASGASVALEAARGGLSVALVEQDDIASGTSSRSSRLIHGGLRYLAQGELALVREGLYERKRLLREAPGLVRPVSFLYPVYRGDPDGLAKVDLGLWIYDFLSLGDGLGFHRRWSARRVHRQLPALRGQGLRGALRYRDAATHDARLTLAVAIAAAEAGALVAPRCRAVRLARASDGGLELEIEDRIGGTQLTVGARKVLLACGPWPDFQSDRAPIRTARGSHVAFSAGRLRLPAFLALRSPDDGRLAFAMPIGAYIVLGTTDVDDSRPPSEVAPTGDDVAYLLRLARHAFPHARLEAADLTGAWAGLRPLLAEPGTPNPDLLSRRHRVLETEPGVFVLQGGKLTTHRRMAEDTLARIEGRATQPRPPHRALLSGSLAEGAAVLRRLGTKPADVEELEGLYGARLDRLAERAEAGSSTVDLEERILRAQIELAVDEEWACALDDLLLRRLAPGPLNLRAAMRLAPWAAELMAERLDWSEGERERQCEDFLAAVGEEMRGAGLEEKPAPNPLHA